MSLEEEVKQLREEVETLKKALEENTNNDKIAKDNISEISEKVVELIQNEDAEYWKIMKKIIWKDNYLAERITELESEMKRNFKEDVDRWLDEIDDDRSLYNKIMSEVFKRIEEEVAAGHRANESLYKRILFKLRHNK